MSLIVLKEGMKHEQVSVLHALLEPSSFRDQLYEKLLFTGELSEKVQGFQQVQQLKDDGIVGNATWRKLGEQLMRLYDRDMYAKKPNPLLWVKWAGLFLRTQNRCPLNVHFPGTAGPSGALRGLDVDRFLHLYALEYGGLKKTAGTGLRFLLSKMKEDSYLTDLRWAAYMLATVKHECANSWQPIREYKPAITTNAYWTPDANGNTYFGRGYVQLTWKANYQKAKEKFKMLGMNVDLVGNPDLALEPEHAYWIMSCGMREGWFTTKALGKYFANKSYDYWSARKIINGTDCAAKIEEYGFAFESMLRLSLSV